MEQRVERKRGLSSVQLYKSYLSIELKSELRFGPKTGDEKQCWRVTAEDTGE